MNTSKPINEVTLKKDYTMIKTITISLPEYFANALINNDYQNLTEIELKTALDYHDVTINNCLSCTDEPYIGRFNNLFCTMLDYTFKTN